MNGAKLPNFLIVGAAKSGTTSVNYYLKEHRQIYMCPVKEPKFFTAQFLGFPLRGVGDAEIEKRIVKTFDEYEKLFRWATDERKAIGDASVDNLYYHEGAVKQIKKYLGDPKIIIFLRNPADRAFSAYTHLVRDGRETLSFEEGLEKENSRIEDNWEFIWFYKDVGLYFEQVRDYLENFTDVKIYLTDDLEKDPMKVVKEIYGFLGVDTNFVPDTSVRYNVSGITQKKLYGELLKKANAFGRFMEPIINTLFPKKSIKFIRWAERLRTKNLVKPEMNPDTRRYLAGFFREDLEKLQKLINRDLSKWMG